MKKSFALALAALLGLAASAPAARVAYVDVKKVFENYSGTQTAKETLRKRMDEEASKLEKEKEALNKEAAALKGKKSVLTEAKFAEQARKIQEKGEALEKKYRGVMGELQMQEAKQTAQILDLVREACAKVAKKEKYEQVFDSNALLFGGEEITATVIQAVNGK